MIVSKVPLRVSFVGGGSDLPSHFVRYGGCVVSAAINKYVYVLVRRRSDGKITYLNEGCEPCSSSGSIRDTLVREAVQSMKIDGGIDLAVLSDVSPFGSGLGASSAVVVGIISALSALNGNNLTGDDILKSSVEVEIVRAKRNIGIQDFLPAIYGGIAKYTISTEGSVTRDALDLGRSAVNQICEMLYLRSSGQGRDSANLISSLTCLVGAKVVERNTAAMTDLARIFYEMLNSGNLGSAINVFNKAWELKVGTGVIEGHDRLREIYDDSMGNGALGGKLLGAGGGGTFLFFVPGDRPVNQHFENVKVVEHGVMTSLVPF